MQSRVGVGREFTDAYTVANSWSLHESGGAWILGLHFTSAHIIGMCGLGAFDTSTSSPYPSFTNFMLSSIASTYIQPPLIAAT